MTSNELTEWFQTHWLLFVVVLIPSCYVVVRLMERLVDFATLLIMSDD